MHRDHILAEPDPGGHRGDVNEEPSLCHSSVKAVKSLIWSGTIKSSVLYQDWTACSQASLLTWTDPAWYWNMVVETSCCWDVYQQQQQHQLRCLFREKWMDRVRVKAQVNRIHVGLYINPGVYKVQVVSCFLIKIMLQWLCRSISCCYTPSWTRCVCVCARAVKHLKGKLLGSVTDETHINTPCMHSDLHRHT